MPHSYQQRSPSPTISGGKPLYYEEELDEFGRVKQRRSHFGADGIEEGEHQRSTHSDRRRHENDTTGADNKDYSDGDSDGSSASQRRSSFPRQRRTHRRRNHHSRSLSPPPSSSSSSRYLDDKDNDDDHHHHHHHHHRHSHRHRHHSQSRHRYNSSDEDEEEDRRSSSVDSYDSHDRYRHQRRRRHSSASPRRYHDHRRHRRQSSEMDDRLRKKIYIGDLANVSSSELEQVFSKFGRITHVKLIEGKEYGFITFEEAASAQEAISMMDGTVVGSHKIKVNRAKMMDRSRHSNLTWMDEDGGKSYGSSTSGPKIPPLDTLDPPIQRTLTSYDDLL
ncbi:hypothetical protein BCR42DRAFT_428189 [Absidia repens]|uniref:RRM domain-containing protein n=1 Tax=Absidia repens TaxID=90262 RepID=A0A1X2HYL4_9FUNG|nr:hypothetical protein BCR42DRAFT_428189 [Absidia repens]